MFTRSAISAVLLSLLFTPTVSPQGPGRRLENLGKHFAATQRTPQFARKSEILAAGLERQGMSPCGAGNPREVEGLRAFLGVAVLQIGRDPQSDSGRHAHRVP